VWLAIDRVAHEIGVMFKYLAMCGKGRFNGARAGWVAQLVEQRTENPCVAGSIPASATKLHF
jgi:hypothetical protein